TFRADLFTPIISAGLKSACPSVRDAGRQLCGAVYLANARGGTGAADADRELVRNLAAGQVTARLVAICQAELQRRLQQFEIQAREVTIAIKPNSHSSPNSVTSSPCVSVPTSSVSGPFASVHLASVPQAISDKPSAA
ncbi:unnamed protein product, partial [Protopolystoma xenopodis]